MPNAQCRLVQNRLHNKQPRISAGSPNFHLKDPARHQEWPSVHLFTWQNCPNGTRQVYLQLQIVDYLAWPPASAKLFLSQPQCKKKSKANNGPYILDSDWNGLAHSIHCEMQWLKRFWRVPHGVSWAIQTSCRIMLMCYKLTNWQTISFSELLLQCDPGPFWVAVLPGVRQKSHLVWGLWTNVH